MDGYRVNIKVYEGPLDLLLYLIKRNEMKIYDIPIAEITDQYVLYLDLMQMLNLEMAGDFLVLASQLKEIKSRMLLPPEEEEKEEGPDPRAELVQKLLEYSSYRDAAELLAERDILNRDVFARKFIADEVKGLDGDEVVIEANLFDLLTAFKEVMERASYKGIHEIDREDISVADRINEILGLLSSEEKVSFASLFPQGVRRIVIIVTFLAILELVRLKLVRALQKEYYGEIWLHATEKARSGVKFTEADLNVYR